MLSSGRLIVGCGVGWLREEFEAVGAPPYDERGAVGDEYIHAFKELWTSDDPSFEGKYCRFSDITFLPKPVQRPHPPIWIGGESPPALRRAARLGDAWYPIGDNPRFPVGTAQQIAESFARVRRHVQDAGRDPEDVRLAFSCSYKTEKPDGQRRVFTGAPEQVAGDIWAFEQGGVSYLHLNFQTDSLAQTPERMERFAGEVRPLVEA